jgi:hypothetical protein
MSIPSNRITAKPSMYSSSTPVSDLDKAAAADFSKTRAGIVESVKLTAEQKVKALKERFKSALIGVATNRKQIYDIIIELKEHHHEYGYKSAAAAVEDVCQRTKRWANNFCADVEAEAEICEVGNGFPTRPDTADKKEEVSLKQVEKAREIPEPPKDEEEEKPRVKTRDEVLADNAEKNGEPVVPQAPPKVKENGKPKSQLVIWREMEESLGRLLNRADELNRICPGPVYHSQVLNGVKHCMGILEKWKAQVK